ncbi:MAG: FMN-binding protein [Firmicutes bacterium]|nr:FMN-binding protein [Bacillota bacterium]
MTKRICALLLAACLGLALFACGKSGQAGLKPGTYTGIGAGHSGPIEVELTIDDAGGIANIVILSQSETPGYAAGALALLPKSIAEKQSLGVDAVAGATLSSQGILAAVADAITQAGGDPKDYGFVSVGEKADASEIVVTGLPGGDFTLTGAQLKGDYELTELDAYSINSMGTEKLRHAKGVLLETILQRRGASQADYASALAASGDGYSIALPGEVLRTRQILIAFELEGETIAPRLVIPEERAMYWVKSVRSIALSVRAEPGEITREVSFSDLLARLGDKAESYKYKDADCKALPAALLLEAIGAGPADFVTFAATDGLVKDERYSTFAGQYIVFEGTPDAPLFIGPDLPEGMRVKNIESIRIGGVLVK